MALDRGECIEMLQKIVSEIDYDIYKEMLDEESDVSFDDLVNIVEEYVKINP